MSLGTIKKYLHVSQKMGELEAFDSSQAALDWLRGKTRREWILSVNKEVSIVKEQQKFNQTK